MSTVEHNATQSDDKTTQTENSTFDPSKKRKTSAGSTYIDHTTSCSTLQSPHTPQTMPLCFREDDEEEKMSLDKESVDSTHNDLPDDETNERDQEEDQDEDEDEDEDEDYMPSDQELDKSQYSSESESDDHESVEIKPRRSRRNRQKRDSFIVYTDEEDSELEIESDYAEEEDEVDLEADEVEHVRTMLLDALKKKLNRSSQSSTNIEESLTEEETVYFNKLNDAEKERLKTLYSTIISVENNDVPVKFQILNSQIDNYLKNIALQKYDSLMQMDDPSHGEYHKLNNWITTLCRIPFGKYTEMPVNSDSDTCRIREFLLNTKNILKEEVYGHNEAKEQILRIVAQWISNPKSKGNVIGIHGNPGVGKTTLIKNGVCKALNLPFAFIPLGGAHDSAYLEGHSYTYEGSSNGKIVDVLMRTKIMNPVIYFDELDKVSESKTGQDIINILIHLTDPSQNACFQDKYFSNIDFDLSKCLIIFTYNDNDRIDPILKDRMITIHTKDYTARDKIQIATGFLIPSIQSEFNIQDLEINEEIIQYIIEKISKEAGVRNLKRAIERIVSNINLDRLLNEQKEDKIVVNREHVDKYINDEKQINESVAHLYT